MKVLPIVKLVKEVIGDMKQVSGSQALDEARVMQFMLKVRSALQTDHEGFIEVFVSKGGIYELQHCLSRPLPKVIQQVFEIVPHFFKFQSARELIKGKLDFFTALYQFMDHKMPQLRSIACQCFCSIIMKLSKGAHAFNLITKAATNQAYKNNKAPFDELILSLSIAEPPNHILRLLTLQFINLIIYKAPSERKKAQFLARLENLGLYDELQRIGRECNGNQKIISQLQNFQWNTGQVLAGIQFENELHKERCK